MLALTEKQMLIQALGQCIVDEVARTIKPFQEKLAEIEKSISQVSAEVVSLPVMECKGADLELVKDLIKAEIKSHNSHINEFFNKATEKLTEKEVALQDWTINYVKQVMEALPQPVNGKDGRDGVDGKDGKDGKDGVDWDYINEQLSAGMEMLRDQLDKKIAALPKPEKGEKGDQGEPGKDGKDGRDGVDGKSVSMDEVRAYLADLVLKAIGDIELPHSCVGGFVDRSGHLHLSFSDGSNSDLGEIVGRDGRDADMEVVRQQVATYLTTIEKPQDGKDGKDGKDGLDGVGFDDLQLEFDGERLVQLKFIKGEQAKVFNLSFPSPIYRGIWKEGEYVRADMVTRSGSVWIAMQDTKAIPGSPDSGWLLCTKSGRDGKDGKQGPEGPQGKAGRDGRDLTQIGPNGEKW